MKKILYVPPILLALLLLLVPACDWLLRVPLVVEEPLLRILDINSTKIFNDAHIPGAINIPLKAVGERSQNWNKNTPIVTYCSDYNCKASHKAADELITLGFSDVSVYAGGISEWYKLSKGDKDEYPVEGPAQLPFLERVVDILDPNSKETNVVTAEVVSQRIQQIKN